MINLELNQGEKIAFISDIHFDNHSPMSRLDDIMYTAYYKLEDIRKKCVNRNVKAVFLEGDVVNRIGTTHQAINLLGDVLLKFKESGIRVFSILGNHDIVRNSLDAIDKSPVQTLFTFGVIEHINLENKVCINNKILITPVDYTEYPVSADENFSYNILLAHMFFRANQLMADEKHNLTDDNINQLGYDLVVLGHDHEEYPDLEVGKSLIIRHGSLLRGTAHNYNFDRKPNFLVLNDLDNINKDTIEKVVVEHQPYENVASNYIINKKQDGTVSGLKEVLSNLADKLSMTSDVDGDRILDIIKTDTELPNDSRIQLLNYINEIL